LFCFSLLVIFSGKVSCFCLGLASDGDPPTNSLPCTGTGHHICFILLRWGLTNLFPGLVLNHDPPNFCLSNSQQAWAATPGYFQSFYDKRILNFVKCFFCMAGMIMLVFL
jgi:hypothetical protein